jgi:hypothetical protein
VEFINAETVSGLVFVEIWHFFKINEMFMEISLAQAVL